MKARRTTRFLSDIFVSAILLLCSVTVFRGAEEPAGSITLCYELSDSEFTLYKIGNVTENGAVCTEQFTPYHVDLKSENAAQTLAAYIQRDKLSPLASVKTNAKGEVRFDGLSKGVYLTIGESNVRDGMVYSVMPSIISLPYTENDSEKWDAVAYVKYIKSTQDSNGYDLSVVKVWKSSSGRTTYPDVTVQLLGDGEVYDTVVLNAANSWKHSWTALNSSVNWTVTEKELDADYTVDISNNNHVFTITNSVTDEPETTVAVTTAPVTTPTAPTTKPGTPNPTIPQTGQLNWPIPVLGITGAALILIGLLMFRKKRHE